VKAVGVVGYKKSGKTTLIIRLSQELSGMGYSVAILAVTHQNSGRMLPLFPPFPQRSRR
jgi:molybdopterin-guanine dinucleotide biosynthesis protein